MTAAAGLALYCVVVVGLLIGNYRWARLNRARRIDVAYPACVPVPKPTTPPFTQTLADPEWFAGIPSDCLSDDAVHSLFDSIVAGEFQ